MTLTLILPYYRNVAMLERQADEWERYPEELRVIVVDDGSPEPALDFIRGSRASVYRIQEDIPWNRNGARNLGNHVAETPFILHTDIDHLLLADQATALCSTHLDPEEWYKFRRFRRGAADETRQKDDLSPTCEYGEIKPHIDSFLCTPTRYWQAGGYDERYSGSLGGSAPFLSHMHAFGPPIVLDIYLEVFTRAVIRDASDFSLSRDRSRFKDLRRKLGDEKPTSHLHFAWEQVQ